MVRAFLYQNVRCAGFEHRPILIAVNDLFVRTVSLLDYLVLLVYGMLYYMFHSDGVLARAFLISPGAYLGLGLMGLARGLPEA